MKVTNSSNAPLAFKVKTTAPKLYCVRPNSGVVQPGSSLQVSIILQGLSQTLPADYKCKDKFLLVSLPAPEVSDPSNVAEQWADLEAAHKSEIVSKKLKVNYVILDHDPQPSENGHSKAAAYGGGDFAGNDTTFLPQDAATAQATPLKNTSTRDIEQSTPAVPQHSAPAPPVQEVPSTPLYNQSHSQQYEQRSSPQDHIQASPQQLFAQQSPQQPKYLSQPLFNQQYQQPSGPVPNGVTTEMAIIMALIAFMVGYFLSSKLN